MPPKYGNISKVHIAQDDQLNQASLNVPDQLITLETVMEYGDGTGIPVNSLLPEREPNPLAMNFYTLGYDNNKKLTNVNRATKENIKTYLGPYRMMTDAINIKDAFIINIGIKFDIFVKREYNKEEIILKCVEKVKQYFDIDKWQINQPIILADVAYEISLVEGVNNIVPPAQNNPEENLIIVENKFDTSKGYAGNIYNIGDSIRKGVLYPSLDPSIFEVRFPDIDIQGRVVGDY